MRETPGPVNHTARNPATMIQMEEMTKQPLMIMKINQIPKTKNNFNKNCHDFNTQEYTDYKN